MVGLEVHPATGREVAKVVAKKKAALSTLASHLRSGARVRRWFWAASGSVGFVPFEKAKLMLDAAGIVFVGSTLEKRHLEDAVK